MSKIKSRKLWAFIVWALLTLVHVIFGKTIDANIIEWFGRVTLVYISFQGAVDAVLNWKGKNE